MMAIENALRFGAAFGVSGQAVWSPASPDITVLAAESTVSVAVLRDAARINRTLPKNSPSVPGIVLFFLSLFTFTLLLQAERKDAKRSRISQTATSLLDAIRAYRALPIDVSGKAILHLCELLYIQVPLFCRLLIQWLRKSLPRLSQRNLLAGIICTFLIRFPQARTRYKRSLNFPIPNSIRISGTLSRDLSSWLTFTTPLDCWQRYFLVAYLIAATYRLPIAPAMQS